MATRGFVGMTHNSRMLTTYVHRDASPGNVGLQTLVFAKAHLDVIEAVAKQFFALTTVDRNEPPTPEQLAQLKERLKGMPAPTPQGGINAIEREAAILSALGFGTPDFSRGVEDLQRWPDLSDLAHGDLSVFLHAGFLPVLYKGHPTTVMPQLDLEWGYVINLDRGEVEAHHMRPFTGMEPGTWRISFGDLSLYETTELPDLVDDIQELKDGDDPDRELAELNMIQSILAESREEKRREREDEKKESEE